jgi:hypothetical protein
VLGAEVALKQGSEQGRPSNSGSFTWARLPAAPAWSVWILVAFGMVVFLTAVAIHFVRADVRGVDIQAAEDLAWPTSFALFVVVGGLVAARRPDNLLGWGFLGIGLTQVLEAATFEYAVWAHFDRVSLPLGGFAAWVSVWIWIPGITLFPFLVLLFPTGRLPSPRWRWLARATILNSVVGTVAGMSLARHPTRLLLAAPFSEGGVPGSDISMRIQAVVFPVALLFIAAAMVSFIVRFRRSTGIERQQLKWVAFVIFLGLLNVVLFELGADSLGINNVAIDVYSATLGGPGMLALAAGFAILRHRLFDIDVVINRTVVYLLLTGALAVVYSLGVVLLQGVLPGGNSQLAVAASTLAVAAAFRPLLLRIQRFVDRSFYREKYDAQQTLESFNARLRDELDLDSLLVELRSAVIETMHPRNVSVWLAAGRGSDVPETLDESE